MYFTRFAEDDNTIARLVARWQASADEVSGEPGTRALPDLDVGRFTYTSGQIHYRDEVPDSPFETEIDLVDIHLENFSTSEDNEIGEHDLVLLLEDEARVFLAGEFIVDPLQLAGRVAVTDFRLAAAHRYLEDELPFDLGGGELDVSFTYDISLQADGPHLVISDIDGELIDLTLLGPGAVAPFLQSGTLSVNNGQYHFPANALMVESLELNAFEAGIIRSADGNIDWIQLISSMTGPEDDATDFPLSISILNVAIRETAITFQDRAPETPVNLYLHIDAFAEDFNPEQASAFTADIRLGSGGTLQLQGDALILPDLALNLELAASQLSILPLQAYLDEVALVDLMSGTVSASAALRHNADEPLSFQGDMSLTDVLIHDRAQDEALLSLEAVAISAIDFSLADFRLDVSEVLLDGPYVRLLIDESAQTNISQVIRDDRPEEAEADGAPGPAFTFSMGRMQISDASARFTDHNLPFVFDAEMETLNGELGGFSSTADRLMQISLEGQVDEFGLVEIIGSMNPLELTRETAIEMSLRNLILPAMSPYSIKFAGREITEGRSDLDLFYQLADGELNANNRIVIRNISLGDSVDSPGALSLPLDLAIALLEDEDGVIDLEIPVRGELDDPEFDLGPLIRDALFSTLRSVVEAPFRFLAGLVEESDDDFTVSDVLFRAGLSDIPPPEREKLLNLSQILEQRPQLILQVPAPLAEDADRKALQESHVDARIAQQLEVGESDELFAERQMTLVERLYEEAVLSPDLSELRDRYTDSGDESDNGGLPSMVALDAQAYTSNLRARLIREEVVTDDQLADLATDRQQAVIDFLKENSGLKDDRLAPQDIVSTEFSAGWLHMEFGIGFPGTDE